MIRRPPSSTLFPYTPLLRPRRRATPPQLLKPSHRDIQPAERRMRIPELHVAVPIRAATDGHAEPLCDAGDPPLGARRMARVPHFEAVETLLLELSDLAFGAVVTEVGRDGNPADGVDQLGDLLQGDRKSTRLNSSHSQISYAVFCLKKKKKKSSDLRITDAQQLNGVAAVGSNRVPL